jgi:hypothetical protein
MDAANVISEYNTAKRACQVASEAHEVAKNARYSAKDHVRQLEAQNAGITELV